MSGGPKASEPSGPFGSALASGDLFGTSADELVVGASNDVIDVRRGGSVFIYQGSGSGLTTWAPVPRCRNGTRRTARARSRVTASARR